MKYSNNYILYPLNRALERAIADSLHLLSDEAVGSGNAGYTGNGCG